MRDSHEPDIITVSYVHLFAVYNVAVYFDIRGFFVDPTGQTRLLTIEDVLQYVRRPLVCVDFFCWFRSDVSSSSRQSGIRSGRR